MAKRLLHIIMILLGSLILIVSDVHLAQAQVAEDDDERIVLPQRPPTLLERLMFWRQSASRDRERERTVNPYANYTQSQLDEALWRTVHNFDATTMKALLDEGASPNFRNNQRRTVLIEAARIGFYDGVRLLIEYGASVNSTDMYGGTAYLYAYRGGYSDITLLLQRNGARTTNF